MNDGFEILEFGGVRRTKGDGAHEVSHACHAVFTQTSSVCNGRLNGGFVERVTLNKMRPSVDEVGDAFTVASQERDMVTVVK